MINKLKESEEAKEMKSNRVSVNKSCSGICLDFIKQFSSHQAQNSFKAEASVANQLTMPLVSQHPEQQEEKITIEENLQNSQDSDETEIEFVTDTDVTITTKLRQVNGTDSLPGGRTSHVETCEKNLTVIDHSNAQNDQKLLTQKKNYTFYFCSSSLELSDDDDEQDLKIDEELKIKLLENKEDETLLEAEKKETLNEEHEECASQEIIDDVEMKDSENKSGVVTEQQNESNKHPLIDSESISPQRQQIIQQIKDKALKRKKMIKAMKRHSTSPESTSFDENVSSVLHQ